MYTKKALRINEIASPAGGSGCRAVGWRCGKAPSEGREGFPLRNSSYIKYSCS